MDLEPYGSWASPITAELLVSGAVGRNEIVVDGNDVWVAESRPSEAGRTVLVRVSPGDAHEPLPGNVDVRTRVHEYGGGAWWVHRGVVVFADDDNQRLWKFDPDGAARPVALTPEPSVERALRYADGRLTDDLTRFICVRETHGDDGEPSNEIVSVPVDGSAVADPSAVATLVSGVDFVSSPRCSPDGMRLAWLQWHHPDMPWDATELWVGDLSGNATALANSVACGGDRGAVPGADEGGTESRGAERVEVSLSQPEWAPDGGLWVLSDRSGWSNLYRIDPSTGRTTHTFGGDFDIATPHWVFGLSRYGFGPDGCLWYVEGRPSGDRLMFAEVPGRSVGEPVDLPAGTLSSVRVTTGGDVVVIAGTHDRERRVLRVSAPRSGHSVEIIRDARDLGLDPGFFVEPEVIHFATSGGATAHALFYRPSHPTVGGPSGERPPLMVRAHGGPTAAARNELQLELRYWTSRGWAVVDVDYRGSTGYGRAYMRLLDGQWGVADVDDCVAAARFLADRGDVDRDRLAIRGGSAGGFTVLAALAFHEVFTAGATRYGVADLTALAEDTHKFESRYLDRLIGPWPEAREVYEARSPINHTDTLSCPMIVLQGGEDLVVPPNQAKMLVAALAAKGLDHQYVEFPDEGHGFRKSENILAALRAEEQFFAHQFAIPTKSC